MANEMRYTLITSKGVEMKFYLIEMANLYQSIYGGIVSDSQAPKTSTNIVVFKPKKVA